MSNSLSDEEFDTLPDAEPVTTKPLSDEEFDALPDTPQVEQPDKDDKKQTTIPPELKGATIGAVVGSIPGLTAEIGGTITEKAATARSPYTPDQLQLLASEYDRLKTIDPTETMAKVGEKFSEQNRIINEIEKEAYAQLSEPISKQEYREAVVSSTQPLTRQVDPTTEDFLKAKQEFTPTLQTIDPIAKQEQEQLEKFASKKASEIIENKRKSSLGTIPEEQLLNEYNQLKNQIKQNKEGFSFEPNMEKALKDFEIQKNKIKELEKLAKLAAYKKLETPYAKEFPALKGRLYSSAYENAEQDIARILKRYQSGELLKGEDAYKIVRDIRESVFDKDGTIRIGKDVAKEVQRGLRELVGSKNPEASALFEEMSNKIQDLERLEKTGYIKRNKDVSKAAKEFIQFGKDQQSKIIKDIAPNLYAKGVDVSGDVALRLAELKKALPEKLYNELELAVLKTALDDPAKKATLSNWDLAVGTIMPKVTGIKVLDKWISSPSGSLKTYRFGKGLKKLAKPIAGVGATVGGLGGAIGAQAAEEAFDPETSGALPTELDLPVTYENAPIPEDLRSIEGIQSSYWFERGVRDPEEQIQRSRLTGFKKGLEERGYGDYQKTPSAYEKPEVKAYKEKVMQAEKLGALAPTYVEAPKEKVLKADNPAEIASVAQAMQSSPDKASQEYSRVLSQIVNSPASQKEAVLFGLNQQPAFRELVRKLKDEQKTEEETPLMLKGPA